MTRSLYAINFKEWLRRNRLVEALLIFALVFSASYVVLDRIEVKIDNVGLTLINHWCSLRDASEDCYSLFNSKWSRVEQTLSLSLFITVIALTAISMHLRYFAAVFSLVLLVFLGVVPPQELIMGVEWRLILFLIGSMIFAYILRTLGVFRFIALVILKASRGSPTLFVLIMSLISWFLAIAVDEATSIIYIVMLLLDLRKLIKKDVLPLVMASVLATNTGSMAMPVGNPIGLYLAFTTGLTVIDFITTSLPLSLIALISLVISARLLLRGYLHEVVREVKTEKIDIILTEFYATLDRRGKSSLVHGLVLLCGFLVMVSLSGFVSKVLSSTYGSNIDQHSLLPFIPYIFVLLSLQEFEPERLEKVLIRGVEWPSIFFFMSLFMLGHSLLWTGVAIKIAYIMGALSATHGQLFLRISLLEVAALTSAFLDNLSVIVAFTPVVQSLVNIGVPRAIYWSLLFGGVLGGNFTPIGSTANIVALGLCEKSRLTISWKYWAKIAIIPTLVELLIANTWVLMMY